MPNCNHLLVHVVLTAILYSGGKKVLRHPQFLLNPNYSHSLLAKGFFCVFQKVWLRQKHTNTWRLFRNTVVSWMEQCSTVQHVGKCWWLHKNYLQLEDLRLILSPITNAWGVQKLFSATVMYIMYICWKATAQRKTMMYLVDIHFKISSISPEVKLHFLWLMTPQFQKVFVVNKLSFKQTVIGWDQLLCLQAMGTLERMLEL